MRTGACATANVDNLDLYFNITKVPLFYCVYWFSGLKVWATSEMSDLDILFIVTDVTFCNYIPGLPC